MGSHTGVYEGQGHGWKRGRGWTGVDWDDPVSVQKYRNKAHTAQNARSLDDAKKHREFWTDEQDQRIMDTDQMGRAFAASMGRTITACKRRKDALMARMVAELDEVYDGPILYGGDGDDEVDKATLRSATTALIGVAIEKDKVPDHWEMVSLCSMLGHEFEGD